jgi:HEAT repeat protein
MSPETPSSQPNRAFSLADAVTAIGQGDFSHRVLITFSDLSREQAHMLERRWYEPDAALRARFILALSELAETSVQHNFSRVFRIGLHDPDEQVRQRSIAALWEDDSTELMDMLIALLGDNSQDVRAEAAQALGAFAIRCEAGELSESDAQKLSAELERLAADVHEAHLVQRRALESLAAFGRRPIIYELVRSAYDHGDPMLRAGAVFAMGRSLDRRWFDTLLSEFNNADPEMRYEAARAAGEFGDNGAVEGLAKLTSDPDAEVRMAAVDALTKIASPGSERVLRRLAERASGEEQAAILDALEQISATDFDD